MAAHHTRQLYGRPHSWFNADGSNVCVSDSDFGFIRLGHRSGLISTIIFAIAAPIRLTYLGVTKVPEELIEAGKAFGARPHEIADESPRPSGCFLPSIMAGVTQCLLCCRRWWLSLLLSVLTGLVNLLFAHWTQWTSHRFWSRAGDCISRYHSWSLVQNTKPESIIMSNSQEKDNGRDCH